MPIFLYSSPPPHLPEASPQNLAPPSSVRLHFRLPSAPNGRNGRSTESSASSDGRQGNHILLW